MKRIISALLIIVLVIGATGCSSNNVDSNKEGEYKRLERWYE